MQYSQTLRYLESCVNYEQVPSWRYRQSLKLERFQTFLARIGNPQKNLSAIHVAGSKGKGSTCAFITYILREAGFSVGLYTSPHLSDFRERIRILRPDNRKKERSLDFEGMISRQELARIVSNLKPEIDSYNRSSLHGPLTFFEVYTAVAFEYFRQQRVDFVVLETGLGGRFDATNVADSLVAVITPISYEHTDKLGATLTLIAREKSGIIKTGFAISAPQDPEARLVLRERASRKHVLLHEVSAAEIRRVSGASLALSGMHQRVNASVARASIQALRHYGVRIPEAVIRRGFSVTQWPGRCEVVRVHPTVVLDGAQNRASAYALMQTISSSFRSKRIILVLGVSQDKKIAEMCRILIPAVDTVILSEAKSPRATCVTTLEQIVKDQVPKAECQIVVMRSVRRAVQAAISRARKEDLILVTGSLFVVGEAREALRKGCS